jgi:hypothetical protein
MIKAYRKIVTFKSWLNWLLRQPQRVTMTKLDTGIVIVERKYKNKTIIKLR